MNKIYILTTKIISGNTRHGNIIWFEHFPKYYIERLFNYLNRYICIYCFCYKYNRV